MSDSLQPHRLKPPRLLCPWNSPGKNTGESSHFLPQGIYPTQGLNPGLLYRGDGVAPAPLLKDEQARSVWKTLGTIRCGHFTSMWNQILPWALPTSCLLPWEPKSQMSQLWTNNCQLKGVIMPFPLRNLCMFSFRNTQYWTWKASLGIRLSSWVPNNSHQGKLF